MRVLVVDDDRQLVRLVQSYLLQAGFDVLTASDGKTALQTIRSEHPDLVILDLMLPDLDGWDITRTVRNDEQLSRIPIIMLTARVEDADKIIGLELGADDYITKPFNPREVVARVRSVIRRATDEPIQPRLLQIGDLMMDLNRHEVTINQQLLDVTPTEFEILRLFMENPGHAFTRLGLIEKGPGYSYIGMERAIDTHIKNVRKKIEPDPSNPTYIQTVYGIGYRMNDKVKPSR
jgi:two-component system, OmpR family, alkaline phosphatase synthesis response regulator PhoP